MNKQLSPAIAIALIVFVLAGAGFFLWKKTASPAGGSQGRLESDLDMNKMEKDPEKLKKGVDDLLKRDGATSK